VAKVVEEDGAERGKIPPDMVTSSGSGLDPHVSPANAALQIARVARARGITEDSLRTIVALHTEGRQFGFLGEPRVNVLRLNLDLDRKWPR
jgi:K+-transporting ATPase ATPase C chain